jgi:ferrous iron transport protein A
VLCDEACEATCGVVPVGFHGALGRDPIAIRVGRMTVAIRRRHAGAVRVFPAPK